MLSPMVLHAEQCWHIQISHLQAVRLTGLALAQDKVQYRGESNYSAGMNNGVGKFPASEKKNPQRRPAQFLQLQWMLSEGYWAESQFISDKSWFSVAWSFY